MNWLKDIFNCNATPRTIASLPIEGEGNDINRLCGRGVTAYSFLDYGYQVYAKRTKDMDYDIMVKYWHGSTDGGKAMARCNVPLAEAMEIIPSTLAENCGLSSVNVITELRHRHLKGLKNSGLKAESAQIVDNTIEHHILQPALVNISALGLATEAARMILKIDDILQSR